jgi:antitoxin VapB
MQAERHIRLFRNGRNQALRIPREFELDASEAIIHREGECLIIEPIRRKNLLATLDRLDDLDATLADTDDTLLPLDAVDL